MAQDGIRVHIYGDYDDKQIRKVQRDLESLQKKSRTATQKFQDMGKSMQAMGDRIGKVGGALTKGVTLPLVGIATAATAAAVEFETSMSKIVGLVGIASDEVDGMKDSVLDLSGQTAKAPNELADALFVVTSAGLRGEEAMAALESAAKASAAGLGETSDIARAAAGAINAYGSDVLDVGEATDIVVATARAGNFETSQFASALGKVLPTAKAAKVSLDEVGGATALLTKTNGDAATSITQIEALFKAFATPVKQTQTMLAEVGLTAGDLRDNIGEKGLVDTLHLLDDALGGNREQLGLLLGSSEANKAALQLLDASAEDIAGTFGVVDQSLGMTDEAFGVVAETTGFTLQQALTQLKTTLIEIGDIIAPFVQQFVSKLQVLVDAFKNLSPAQKQMAVLFGAIAAAIGPVLLVVGKVISVVGGVIAVFNPLTLKIAAVIAVVALLAAGFAYLWNNSETLRNTVMDVFETIRATVTRVIDLVKQKIEENRETIDGLKQAFQLIAEFIADKVVPVVAKFYGTYLKMLIKFLGFVVEGIIEVISFWVNFITKIAEVYVAIGRFVADASGSIAGFLGGLQESFRNAFNAVAGFIGGIFQGIYNTITGTIRNAVNTVIGQINRIVNSWNALSFTIPQFSVGVGEASVSFGPYGIGTPDLPTIPALAKGGIVTEPTLALIGEAGPEAVIPLPSSSDARPATTININVTAGLGTDGSEVGRQIVEALSAYERRNGKVYANA